MRVRVRVCVCVQVCGNIMADRRGSHRRNEPHLEILIHFGSQFDASISFQST